MTTNEIANRLVELCRTGQNEQAYKELFSADAEAIEPAHSEAPPAKGLDALLQKSAYFSSMIETMHGASCSDPVVAGNHFSVSMGIDYTGKDGNRVTMDEIAVYEVKDGKIVKEQFFFPEGYN